MEIKEKIIEVVDSLAGTLIKLSHEVHDSPELGLNEFKAAKWQTELLKEHGFSVTMPFCGMDTAYNAVKGTVGEGPQIAFLSEYDALKGLGHACGHNIICAASCGAAIALSKALEGEKACIYVFGTPAEETQGGKIPMVEQGAFDGLDCAMMVHPKPNENTVGGGGLACTDITVEFFGKDAHSSRPMLGINALTSTITLFNSVNAQLHLWPNKSKMNGIIISGGEASNIIPGYSSCKFTMRAERKDQIIAMYDDFVRLANAAAATTGAKVKITHIPIFAERYSNRALDEAFTANMKTLGEDCHWQDPEAMTGSSDIGNVSLVIPTIHEYLSLNAGDISEHTPAFCKAAETKRADDVVLLAAKGLAMTGADVFSSGDVRLAMKKEFDEEVLPHKC